MQRLRVPMWTEWTPPLDFVKAAGPQAEQAMYLRYRLIAAELRDLGIDSNCAPMVDLASSATHEFLRHSCYGDRPDALARLGRATASAPLAGGGLPGPNHMPGPGRAPLAERTPSTLHPQQGTPPGPKPHGSQRHQAQTQRLMIKRPGILPSLCAMHP